MSVHRLRARTLAWVLPVLPSGEQARRAGVVDCTLLSLGLLSVGAGPVAALLGALVPFGRAVVKNGQARSSRHAALMLGSIEGGMFCEGERVIPVPAAPRLHGASAAALVLSDDPHFDGGQCRVEQVYVPKNDEFLMVGDRVRRERMLEIIHHAYNNVA